MADVVVVGAGIGGLTAAHAVAAAGRRAVVVERSTEPTGVGAGLLLWPNAVLALDALGLGAAVRLIGAQAMYTTISDARGRPISALDTKAFAERAGAPMLLVERPALHAVLARGLEIRTGQAVSEADDGGVVLDGGGRIDADAVIGADGIGSVVRAHVAPEVEIVATDKVVVRGVADYDFGVGLATEAWGSGELFGAAALLGGRTYWFYETRAKRLTGRDPASIAAGLAEVATTWPAPFADCIAATDPSSLLVHPIRTTTSLKNWSRGPVAVLGDAAHAMEPNLGQGAAQAIEDATELASALRAHADITTALAAYGRARRARAQRMQRESARVARLALAERLTGMRDAALRAVPEQLRQRALLRLTVA